MRRGVFMWLRCALLAIMVLATLVQPLRAQNMDRNETRSYRMHAVFTSGAILDVIIELTPQLAYHFTRDSRMPGAEAYAIGGMMYARSPRNVWEKFHVHVLSAQSLNFIEHFEQIVRTNVHPNVSVLPTVVEDGVTYGIAHTEIPIPIVAGANSGALESCSYDLTTFRPHTCTTSNAVVHFSAYNDPANEVELPAAAFAARLVNVPAAK
jgi:hypothetical protein